MATVVDHLVISLGLDPRPLQSGLNQVKSLAMRFAGPIAGAFSIQCGVHIDPDCPDVSSVRCKTRIAVERSVICNTLRR